MTEPVSLTLNAAGLADGLGEAGAEIERIARDQIAPAAALIDEAFATAAGSIQSSLVKAAERGELSLKKLTRALVSDLSRYAIDSLVRAPVETLVTSALSGVFGGARAGGGAVAPGAAYLVGERGPELFTPAAPGRVSPLGGGSVNVSIALPGVQDAESFRRSETQIAAALARAVARGRRNL